MEDHYLSVDTLDERLEYYWGRRIKIKLNEKSPIYQHSHVLTCVLGYFDEEALDIDEVEDKDFAGYGVVVDEVEINGEEVKGIGSIPLAHIAGFISLEGENTIEEFREKFAKAQIFDPEDYVRRGGQLV